MAYLDVSPMISALRSSPESFEFRGGQLHHIPSRHQFYFDAQRHVTVDANCGCRFLQVSVEQEPALYEAFREWRTNYWVAIEINREFASHFAPPSRLRRWLIQLTGWLHQAAMTQKYEAERIKSCEIVPAE